MPIDVEAQFPAPGRQRPCERGPIALGRGGAAARAPVSSMAASVNDLPADSSHRSACHDSSMTNPRYLADAAATERAGAALATRLGRGMVVTLHGDLGAGKTTLVRGVLRGARLERVRSRARPTHWLNIIHFRAYTCITLIFIGSPIRANGKQRVLPSISATTRSAWSSGRNGSRDCCRRRTSPSRSTHRAAGAPGRDWRSTAHSPAGERCAIAITRRTAVRTPGGVTRVSLERRRACQWLLLPAAQLLVAAAWADAGPHRVGARLAGAGIHARHPRVERPRSPTNCSR